MNESNADPAFEVRRLKSAPGWYVRVAWAHGKRDHIPGFISEQEARRWIETKARGWVSEQTRVSFKRDRRVTVHASTFRSDDRSGLRSQQ